MKKHKFSLILALLTFVSAFGTFFSVYRAIKNPDASTWLVPMIWTSLFVIAICTMSIFVRQKMEVEIVVAASFLFSLIFAFSFWHFVVLFLCLLLALAALRDIRSDLDLNVKISLWKSLYTGKFKLILAISLLISSQYFFTIKNMGGAVKVPKFDTSAISEKLVGPVLGFVNPNFAAASAQNMTVDQFIMQSQQGSTNSLSTADSNSLDQQSIDSQIPQNLPVDQREALEQQAMTQLAGAKTQVEQKNSQLVLQEGRAQLSNTIGKQLNGNEKISTVFAGLINDRISSFFNPSIKGNSQSALFPLILSIVLLLTIWPIGSVLSVLWFAIIILLFKIFVRFGLVSIKKVTVEREMIV